MPLSNPTNAAAKSDWTRQSVRRTVLHSRALLVLLVLVSMAFGWILLPFYGTILWGTIIAVVFFQTNRRLLTRMPGKRNLAALLTLMLALVMVVLPLVMVSFMLTHELSVLYQQIQTGETRPVVFFRETFNALPKWAISMLGSIGLGDFATVQRKLSLGLTQTNQLLASHVYTFGQDTFSFAVSTFITLYMAFFMIRDGEGLVRLMRNGVPLAHQHKKELLAKFTAVIRATVEGNVVVACIQGMLGGLAFWYLDVSGAFLWAVLMALLSLLPAVGAALVWLPVAVYFLIAGDFWQGAALMAYGMLVIGLIDNLLRPYLVGRGAGLPDYLVLITTVGGIAVFGINGFVLGPVIAAMFIAVWHIYLNPTSLDPVA